MLSFTGKDMFISFNNTLNLNYIYDVESISTVKRACPHCESVNVIKYGSYKNIPRYKCKCCYRTFSSRTNTVWYYSKKSPEVWHEFCLLQMQCTPLSLCAKLLKINIATAFYWRHKLLKVLKNLTKSTILENHVFMLHRFIMESFKGTKGAAKENRSKLWMLFTYDSCGNSINLPYSKNRWCKDIFDNVIYSKLAPKTFISTQGNNFITVFARNHNKTLKKGSSDIIHNAALEIFKTFRFVMQNTHGIATKYLNQYLALVKAMCLNNRLNFETIFSSTSENSYIKSNRIKKIDSTEYLY